MKNLKKIFNAFAELDGPVVEDQDSKPGPFDDSGGKEDEGGEASGNLTWGCYPHASTCTPACPGMAQRWWMFMVDENGCDGDGFIEVPLDFSGTGTFEMHWSIAQLSETVSHWTHEDGDFVPAGGVVTVSNGSENLIRINVRDNFGGPPCPGDPYGEPGNCPENSTEWGILTLDLEYLPSGVTWNPQNISSPDSHWNTLTMLVQNVDPHTGPTIDKETYCEQNPQAPGCE